MANPDIDNVRPVSPRFFGSVLRNEGLSLTAKDALVKEALEGRVNLEEARGRLVRTRQQEKLADLRIEREAFMLSRARDEVKREQDAIVRAGEVSSVLTDLLDDPRLTTADKRKQMARIRLQDPDTFVRNPALRDQFQTLERALPQDPRPPTISEQIALQNLRRGLAKDQADAEERVERTNRDIADREFRAFDEHFQRIEGSRFKKPSDSFEGDGSFEDEFQNPEDRETAIGFIMDYAPFANIEVPNPEILAKMGAKELRRRVGEVNRILRPVLLRDRNPRAKGSSKFGIPTIVGDNF